MVFDFPLQRVRQILGGLGLQLHPKLSHGLRSGRGFAACPFSSKNVSGYQEVVTILVRPPSWLSVTVGDERSLNWDKAGTA